MADVYKIKVIGHLDLGWSDWLDGFALTHQPDGTTVLIGSVADQPALYSLLIRLHHLGLTLLLVKQLDPNID